MQTEITRLDGDVNKIADDTRDAVIDMKSKKESLEKVQNKRADDLGKIILDTNKEILLLFLILLITKYIMFLYSICGMILL
jgi:hypothetical protein